MNRMGVYLHWTLPRFYRSGSQYADSTDNAKAAQKSSNNPQQDVSQPVYPPVPNRWLVVRKITHQVPAGKLPNFQTWVIESDRIQHIDEIPDSVDLEVDVTPFVHYEGNPRAPDIIATQAEIFLGNRNNHSGWQGQNSGWSEDLAPAGKFIDGLTIMDSANPLFPGMKALIFGKSSFNRRLDYTPHNGSVFSIIDSFVYQENGEQHLTSATADYYVIGWHSQTGKSTNIPLSKAGDGTLGDRLSNLHLQTAPDPALDDGPYIQKLLALTDATNILNYGAVYNAQYDFNGKPTSKADQAAQQLTKDAGHNNMEPFSIGTTPLDAVLTFLKAHPGDIETFFPTGQTPVGTDNQPLKDKDGYPWTNTELVKDIFDLASLLYAADDTYDSRIKAQDLLYTNNWGSSQGGFQWKFDNKATAGGPPQVPLVDPSRTPPVDQVQSLKDINEEQALLDAKTSKLQMKRWDLFAIWWKFVSDFTNFTGDKENTYAGQVLQLKKDINALLLDIDQLTQDIGKKTGTYPPENPPVPTVPCKKVPLPTFFQKKDPTICIAGLDSGWDPILSNLVTVKLHSQLQDPGQIKDPNKTKDFSNIFGTLANPVTTAGGLRDTANRILADCLVKSGSTDPKTYGYGYKDFANTNPFQPMFIEWEALYYHIERDIWDVGIQRSQNGMTYQQIGFGIDKTKSLNDKAYQADQRWLSGRILVLPQPVFSLASIVKYVLDNSPDSDLPPNAKAEKTQIEDTVVNLKFISAPLDGLTQHLLTRYTGSHVTPLVRVQGQKVVAMADATDWQGDPLNFKGLRQATDGWKWTPTKDYPTDPGILAVDSQRYVVPISFIHAIDANTHDSNTTPYGNLLPFDPANYPNAPFKGVTHGQMMITKLNIIDKFGQAVCLPTIKQFTPNISPNVPVVTAPPDALYPCISSYLTPDIDTKTGNLNTIFPEPNTTNEPFPLCRFIQLPPAINQPARLNAAFLTNQQSTSYPFWKETMDDKPESPVFCWIVINYADLGLQFFLSDGTFYREVRVGAMGGSTGPKWLPFNEPASSLKESGNKQLDDLISTLSADANYLQAFFDMITAAIGSTPYAPSDYAAYANSLVGKPLALVNVGWWLELATPALKAENTLGNVPKNSDAELSSYEFPIKIGDGERPFDGMLGYFLSDNITNGGKTYWNNLYTYFPSTATSSSTTASAPASGTLAPSGGTPTPTPTTPTNSSIAIEPSNFPVLNPRYINPMSPTFTVTGDTDGPKTNQTYKTYTEARTAQYTITTMLIDPYTPVHAYSPILPITTLQLPSWTIQRAFTRMTAFFRLGPSLLTQDVSTTYDDTRPLNPDTWTTVQTAQVSPSTSTPDDKNPILAAPIPTPVALNTLPSLSQSLPSTSTPITAATPSQVTTATPSIRLPISGKKGLWQWLQPYSVDVKDPKTGKVTGQETKFNALGVDQEDTRIRKDPAPYTFVEGYLQLARPLLSEDLGKL